MRRRIAAALALATLLSPAAATQQKYRSGVDVVRVDALVTDGHKPIGGLTADDFELRDNGVAQTLESAALESLPVSVTFVLDTSGSVAGDKMGHLRAAVGDVLSGLSGEDRAGLVTFSHRVWLRTPLMSDFSGMRTLMSGTEAAGGTALYDAVYAALAISNVQDARPLLVVFSDGLDNMSWMSAELVENAARRANAVVYGVAVAAETRYAATSMGGTSGYRQFVPQPHYTSGQTEFLDAVAAATGGRVLKADTTGNLPQAFADILREFRTRYVIAYSTRGVDTPGWHRIELTVKGRRAEIKTRAGYQK